MRCAFRRAFSDLAHAFTGGLRAGKAAMRAFAIAPMVALLATASAGAVAPPTENQPESVPYGEGLLWKIEREGLTPSYLFGTIHVSYEEIVNLPEAVKTVFDKADSASFEIEMDDESRGRAARVAYYYDWKSLDVDLGPDLYANVIDVAEAYGMTTHHVRKLKPWTLMLILSSPPGVYISREPGEMILDSWLENEAQKQKKKVYGLETIEEHYGVFADLPLKTQLEVIRAMIQQDRIELRAALSTFHEDMIQLYLDRNPGAMLDMVEPGDETLSPEINALIEDRILTQRNHLMVKRMEARLKEGNAFVAVGCAHLPGEEGMVNLLVQQGYKVSRVY